MNDNGGDSDDSACISLRYRRWKSKNPVEQCSICACDSIYRLVKNATNTARYIPDTGVQNGPEAGVLLATSTDITTRWNHRRRVQTDKEWVTPSIAPAHTLPILALPTHVKGRLITVVGS